MASLRPRFAVRRRRALSFKCAGIDRLEARSTVTPVGLSAFALGGTARAAQVGLMHGNGGG